jgi:hypothetical protein
MEKNYAELQSKYAEMELENAELKAKVAKLEVRILTSNLQTTFPLATEAKIPPKQRMANRVKEMRIDCRNGPCICGVISVFPIRIEKRINTTPMLSIWPII